MSKIGLIIKREYTTRVRKKTFIVMTILLPLISVLIGYLATNLVGNHNENQRVVLVDGTHSFCGILTNSPTVNYDYSYCNFDVEAVRKIFMDSTHVSVMFIPASENISKVILYSKADPGTDVISAIEYQMNNIVERSKMKANNLDQKMIDNIKTNINLQNIVNNVVTDSKFSTALAFLCAISIYLFIFLYSVQVMRGVMEEKISRIVEIIISSVKPFQLMMGKVIGVCLVGLTQFVAWIIISVCLFSFGTRYLQSQAVNPNNAKVEQTIKQGTPEQENPAPETKTMSRSQAINVLLSVDEDLRSANWFLIGGCFLFYFLGGYLLYSSLFAAIGSAVDQETETQQFMLPVTAPLILSYVAMISIIQDPHSNLAVWFSIIPLTSPIAMMARIPFGLPVWQLLLSMALLVGTIFGAIWFAGRIYRVGLLMYGKKITYKELGKWLFYK